MAAGRIVVAPYMPARDDENDLVAGARLYVYANKTTTLVSVYAEQALVTPLPNPVRANSSGQFPSIWIEGGTVVTPIGYTVQITNDKGGSIGRPSTFDDFYPTLDYNQATVALTAQYASSTAADAAAAQAALDQIENLVINLDPPLGFNNRLVQNPEWFLGVANPVGGSVSLLQAAANTVFLQAAFNSGYKIDGRGRVYDIVGQVRPNVSCSISNLTLRQRSTDLSLVSNFLIDGVASVELENFTVDINGLLQTGGMGNCSGTQISNCSKVRMRNVSLKNGGAVSAAQLTSIPDLIWDGGEITDFYPATTATEPLDDVCQGIFIQFCSSFRVTGVKVSRMTANWTGRPTPWRSWSRGIVVGQSQDGEIDHNYIGPRIEQGIDITGLQSSYLKISSNVLRDCDTWGIKTAVRFQGITIEDNLFIRPGSAAVTCSAPGDATGLQPQNVTIRNNTAINIGASGYWTNTCFVSVGGRTIAGQNKPSGVVAYGNRIIDDQATNTLKYPFYAVTVGSPDVPWTALPNIPINEEFDNVISLTNPVGYFVQRSLGWSYHRTSLIGTGSVSLPNNAFTTVAFTASPDLDDTAAMHDPLGANPSYITARETGLYFVRMSAAFNNVAGGQRAIGFLVNGGSAYGRVFMPSAGATLTTKLSTATQIILKAGDRVECQWFQDTGGSTTENRAQVEFDISLIQRGA